MTSGVGKEIVRSMWWIEALLRPAGRATADTTEAHPSAVIGLPGWFAVPDSVRIPGRLAPRLGS